MTRTPLLLAALALGFFLSSCSPEGQGESPQSTHQGLSALASGPAVLHYFTTSGTGTRSILWESNLTLPPTATGTVQRTRMLAVEHAAGYGPRGAISRSNRVAWLTLPADRRHGDPAQVWLDGELIDDRALYLQAPLFIDEHLFYLRREPGPQRFDSAGNLLQTLDSFELIRVSPSGQESTLFVSDALWFHIVGQSTQTPSQLLLQRITDPGTHLLEVATTGRKTAAHFLGSGPIRDITPDPARPGWMVYQHSPHGTHTTQIETFDLRQEARQGYVAPAGPRVLRQGVSPFASPLPLRDGRVLITEQQDGGRFTAIPVAEFPTGQSLWREQTLHDLQFVLRGASESRVRLVPPGDAAQDVTLLRRAK
jgi:hypothetical protein